MAWDKYNQRVNKSEFPSAGIYIMVNNGSLDQLDNFDSVKVFKGGRFLKLIVTHKNTISSYMTVDLTTPELMDLNTHFRAPPNAIKDYFLKVSTNVTNPDKEFYHDANGYLVVKRKVNTRPDYKFTAVTQDRINANTYPMTSFAYIKDKTTKLVVFTDRSQGVSIYEDNEIIVNIDRLTFEDGKGVGESYTISANHNMRHKIGVVSATDDIERVWQKQMDEAVYATYGNTQQLKKEDKQLIPIKQTKEQKYLKHTVGFPDNHSMILRVQNLAEFDTLKVNLFVNHQLNLNAVSLGIDGLVDWKESFHNGFPLFETYKWVEVPSDVIDIHRNKVENGAVVLEPLQIRSFRLDFSGKIDEDNSFYRGVEFKSHNLEDIKQ